MSQAIWEKSSITVWVNTALGEDSAQPCRRKPYLANQPGHQAWGAEQCAGHGAVALPKQFCPGISPKAPECPMDWRDICLAGGKLVK